jgi:REP element-mobilizing transposase RayT
MQRNSNPHGHALRKGRFSQSGQIYLLTSITHERRPLFSQWQNGRLAVREFKLAQQDGMCESLAFVIMPDHFHWLVTLENATLPELMRQVRSRSAIQINKALNEKGQIWQRGYHDHALRKEEDMQETARYVVANPLRAGLVKHLADYPLWDAIWL